MSNAPEERQGRIGFAVSARMNPALHAEIVATPESRWQPYSEDSVVVKACCEVDYVPEETGHPYREPLRYVAIRIGKKQQALFADGSTVKYFAVVTNLWEWTPKRLLEWHREKAGSIEAVHDVIKNELAGGVMPCGRFGANAAWLRLAVLTHNVLTALQRLALPPESAPGPAQATAFSDLQHSGEISPSRAPHAAATGTELAAVFQLEARHGGAGFACTRVGKGDQNRLTDGL